MVNSVYGGVDAKPKFTQQPNLPENNNISFQKVFKKGFPKLIN
jgi:hypothetical protein